MTYVIGKDSVVEKEKFLLCILQKYFIVLFEIFSPNRQWIYIMIWIHFRKHVCKHMKHS